MAQSSLEERYYFLLSYSLSIYDEGDREEGRRIARELIKAETMSY